MNQPLYIKRVGIHYPGMVIASVYYAGVGGRLVASKVFTPWFSSSATAMEKQAKRAHKWADDYIAMCERQEYNGLQKNDGVEAGTDLLERCVGIHNEIVALQAACRQRRGTVPRNPVDTLCDPRTGEVVREFNTKEEWQEWAAKERRCEE